MSRSRELARLMNLAAVMLANAAAEVDAGDYTPAERADMAAGLDHLSAALREQDTSPAVVEGELS